MPKILLVHACLIAKSATNKWKKINASDNQSNSSLKAHTLCLEQINDTLNTSKPVEVTVYLQLAGNFLIKSCRSDLLVREQLVHSTGGCLFKLT